MKCPKCKKSDTKVADSRPSDEGFRIYRRRWCLNKRCGYRFSTNEIAEDEHPTKNKE